MRYDGNADPAALSMMRSALAPSLKRGTQKTMSGHADEVRCPICGASAIGMTGHGPGPESSPINGNGDAELTLYSSRFLGIAK